MKVKSVVEVPDPKDATQLHAYLGLVNYQHRFLPNLSTTVQLLNQLLEKNHQLRWTNECETLQWIQEDQGFSDIRASSDPLWPRPTPSFSMWCLSIWIGAVLSRVLLVMNVRNHRHLHHAHRANLELSPNLQGTKWRKWVRKILHSSNRFVDQQWMHCVGKPCGDPYMTTELYSEGAPCWSPGRNED